MTVFDTKTMAVVADVKDLARVHGVLALPLLHRIYCSATGSNELVAIDSRTHRFYFPLQDVGGKPILRSAVPSDKPL